MLIPSVSLAGDDGGPSLSRGVNANSQQPTGDEFVWIKSIKRGEC